MHTTRKEIAQNLKDAGCTATVIETFFKQNKESNTYEQKKILSHQRTLLLEKIHINQKRLDCLDYLIYRLEKNQN